MKNRIKKRIMNALNINEEIINDDFSQGVCQKWDSLRHLNLVIELEDEFDVSFEPEEIADMINIRVIERIIGEKLNG